MASRMVITPGMPVRVGKQHATVLQAEGEWVQVEYSTGIADWVRRKVVRQLKGAKPKYVPKLPMERVRELAKGNCLTVGQAMRELELAGM